MNLLRFISFKIGNDISYNEMANHLGSTVKTIQRYLDILEKTFIIFRLQGFSRNFRTPDPIFGDQLVTFYLSQTKNVVN